MTQSEAYLKTVDAALAKIMGDEECPLSLVETTINEAPPACWEPMVKHFGYTIFFGALDIFCDGFGCLTIGTEDTWNVALHDEPIHDKDHDFPNHPFALGVALDHLKANQDPFDILEFIKDWTAAQEAKASLVHTLLGGDLFDAFCAATAKEAV